MNFVAAVLLSASLSTLPATPLIEFTKSGQALNFDLLIENAGPAKLTITGIEATVLDESGAVVSQRRLQRNGQAIQTLPEREIAPGKTLVVFNPFSEFDSALSLAKIRYEVTFDDGATESLVVAPRVYEQHATLSLPVPGRVFVHDGHDLYSHHRRLDITGEMTTALGIRTNVTRYAYDFTVVDKEGRMFRGDDTKNENWFGFGAPILAPGDGVVLASAADRPDGSKDNPALRDFEAVLKDISLIFGNYVVIDHGNGEYSMLAHLRQGTVNVKPGDRVKRGRKIGEMGCSGDSMFPHLHYQLQSDAHMGEGLPSYFSGFRRYVGTGWQRVRRGSVDTGDIIETDK